MVSINISAFLVGRTAHTGLSWGRRGREDSSQEALLSNMYHCIVHSPAHTTIHNTGERERERERGERERERERERRERENEWIMNE